MPVPLKVDIRGAAERGRAERAPRVTAQRRDTVRAGWEGPCSDGREGMGGSREKVQLLYHHQVHLPILQHFFVAVDPLQGDRRMAESLHKYSKQATVHEMSAANVQQLASDTDYRQECWQTTRQRT